MITTPETLKGKKFPTFIREHLIFKAYPNVDKIFPKLGLKNAKEKVGNPSQEDLKRVGRAAIKNLITLINERKSHLRNVSSQMYQSVYDYSYGYSRGSYVERPQEWKDKKRAALTILTNLTRALNTNPDSFIKIKNKKVSLKLPRAFAGGNFSIVKGRDVFNELHRLNTAVHDRDFPSLTVNRKKVMGPTDTLPVNANVVFSSEGKEGMWDIATMSMRGISSCQRWSAGHRHCLIGSMIDPYTGVIYLSQGKTKYGSKMKRRAVVRLVLHRKTRKPALMIERIYPHDYDHGTKDIATRELFAKFLKKKTNDKYAIVYGDSSEAKKYFIPLSEPVECLKDGERSYRDSHIGYHEINRDIEKYLN